MARMPSFRTYNLLIFLACAIIIGAGFFIEYFFFILPCPLCVLQRICYIAIGSLAIIAFMHAPKNIGKFIYLITSETLIFIGGGLALTQIWFAHHPNKSELCMAGFFNLLNSYSLGESLKIIFNGSKTCSDDGFRILWLTIAEWSLLIFLLLAIINFFAMLFTKNKRRG